MPSLTHTHQKCLAAGITELSPEENVNYLEAPVVFINVDMEETEDIAWKRNRNRKQSRNGR